MIARAVGAEILQDVCEWGFGHAYLEEVVAEWDLAILIISFSFFSGKATGGKAYHAIVGATFASERHRFGTYAFVDDAAGEHGLLCDAEDEGAEAVVIFWFGPSPHTLHSHQQEMILIPSSWAI